MDWPFKAILRAVIVASIAAILFLLVWYSIDVLLVVFAGVLFAVFLRGLGDLLSEHTKLSRGWSFAIVVVGLFLIAAGAVYALWPGVAAQLDQMIKILPDTVRGVINYLERYDWGRWILSKMPAVEQALLSHLNIPALVFKTVDATAAAFIVVFIGIYLGAQSGMYWRGAVRLMPQDRQPGTEALLASVGSTLRWWMVGRSIAMLAVGVLDWIGLSLIGVPLARTLGIISGLLTFIPYIGSMLALIPTMLIALTVNPGLMLSAAIVHFVGQGIEAYLVTPLAQRKVVHMPPALTITAQFLMGAWAGILGLLFSTPLAAIGLVTVKKLYLHEEPDLRKR